MVVTIDGIPVYDALITDEDTGMFKISLVDDPAVMSNFQAFADNKRPQMYAIQDEDKRLVRGVVMRADFPIYRNDSNLGEYYVIYKADQIRKMAEKYLAEGRCNLVNLMHQDNTDVDCINMVQYFIKGDGVSVEGFDNIADGSLFAEFHIVNDALWDEIKNGTYKGFSLEGVFDLVPEKSVSEVEQIVSDLAGAFSKLIKDKAMTKFSRFISALTKLVQEFGNITTDKGILAWDGEEDLKAGDEVFVESAEGERTPAPDGEYTTEDSKVIVVADGVVAEIKDKEAEVAPEPEAAEESEVEEHFEEVKTDKGVLIVETLEVGAEVFVEGEDGNVPAEDGEYILEDGRTVVVAEGKVAEIREPEAEETEEVNPLAEEVAVLKAENEALKAEIAKLRKTPLAKPAHEESKGEVASIGVAKYAKMEKMFRK